jgi:hypothetical protein
MEVSPSSRPVPIVGAFLFFRVDMRLVS